MKTTSESVCAQGISVTEAVVIAVEPGRVRLRLVGGSEPSWARVAVAGYEGTEGDRVLALMPPLTIQPVVIGVLCAASVPLWARRDPRGLTLSTPGDLRVCAPDGSVAIDAGRELTLSADQLVSHAGAALLSFGRYCLRAERIEERATDVYREVEGLLRLRAKHARVRVREVLSTFAKRTVMRSVEDTAIDGRRVLLG